jgi:exodeoxyribonuclease VII large subunit
MKSQWEFGELFPPVQTRKVHSVTELTGNIRRLLEQKFGKLWVNGEISNLKIQNSGHMYFTLKDAGAQMGCVLFRGEFQVDRSVIQDGRKVTLEGEVTVYEARGQYQLRVLHAEPEGLGALQAAFEKLKQRLQAEGCFSAHRKRPLPKFPRRIGIVTSSVGAALQDILHVVRRRNPSLQIILASCRVQGDGAGAEIASAIRMLNEFQGAEQSRENGQGLDLILLTRGGGSLEDLWAFNEEIVARAILQSALPVVSAVGHEIDFTISDFVADFRAPTPSAAAEIITEGIFGSCQFLSRAGERIQWLTRQRLDEKNETLESYQSRLARLHPRRRLDNWQQRMDEMQTAMSRCVKQGLRGRRAEFSNLRERLGWVRPAVVIRQRREILWQEYQRLREQMRHALQECQVRAGALNTRLRLLGPEQVLARGYSITEDEATGKILRDEKDAVPGQFLRTRLHKGNLKSRVEKKAQ